MTEEKPQEKMNRVRSLPTSPKPGSMWSHTKTGRVFKILQSGLHVDGLKPMVVCEDARNEYDFVWVRNLDNWLAITEKKPQEKVDHIRSLPTTPKPESIWVHNKTGGVYKILHIGLQADNGIPVVVYEDARGKYDFVWVRDLDHWLSQDNGKTRFTEITKQDWDVWWHTINWACRNTGVGENV